MARAVSAAILAGLAEAAAPDGAGRRGAMPGGSLRAGVRAARLSGAVAPGAPAPVARWSGSPRGGFRSGLPDRLRRRRRCRVRLGADGRCRPRPRRAAARVGRGLFVAARGCWRSPRPFVEGAARSSPASTSIGGIGWPISFSMRGDVFAVERRGDGDRRAREAGAAGAADAVDVVLGVGRHVEIEDVADRRDIEAAGRDVAGDEQRQLVLAEIVERLRARALVHVAVQRAGIEAVLGERALQRRHVALAVAEDDGVLEVGRRRG